MRDDGCELFIEGACCFSIACQRCFSEGYWLIRRNRRAVSIEGSDDFEELGGIVLMGAGLDLGDPLETISLINFALQFLPQL